MTDEPEARESWFNRNMYVAVFAALLCILLLPVVAVVVSGFFFEPAGLDESPMFYERSDPRPASSNALYHFYAASNTLYWNGGDFYFKNYIPDRNWSMVTAAVVVASNAWLADYVQQGLDMGFCQVPAMTSAAHRVISWVPLRNMSRALIVESELHLSRGNPEKAWDTAMLALRFGGMIQESEGPFITFAVANSMKSMAVRQIVHVAEDARLPFEKLESARQELQALSEYTNAMALAWKIEYQGSSLLIDDLENGKIPSYVASRTDWENKALSAASAAFFNADETRKMLMESYQMLITNTGVSYRQARPLVNLRMQVDDESDLKTVLSLASPNALGKLVHDFCIPSVSKFYGLVSECYAGLAALDLAIVLRRYELDHGELPADLNALVPEYLGAVPIDPMDGMPMRYDPAQRIVYSIGSDLKDDGGSRLPRAAGRRSTNRRVRDIVVPIGKWED